MDARSIDRPTCITCAYAHIDADNARVECRRFPPVTYDESKEQSDNDDEFFDQHESDEITAFDMHRFPRVLDNDWCGEYSNTWYSSQ